MMDAPHQGFAPERLRQAMQRNRKTATALATDIGVTDYTVSRYLSGHSVPRPDALNQIAIALGEPLGFFLRPLPPNVDAGSPSFMRSYAAATKRARLSAEALKERTREVAQYLELHVELPPANFPSFRFGDDPCALSENDIEQAAEDTRRFWGLGDGPIAHVIRLLEHHGAIVVRVDLGDDTLSAFSQWGDPEGRPYIVLGGGRNSAVRSRFDACHELGHMVLHRHLARELVALPEIHKLVEKQANHFAGAFLMPANSFTRSVFLTTLSALKQLKPVWGAAIAAMIVRLTQLDLISERQAKRLWEVYAPWRRGEPLDDVTPLEMPATIRQSFDVLRNDCGISPAQVAADLPFALSDVAVIGGLPLGYFRDESPQVRPKRTTGASMLEFRRSNSEGT